MVLHASLESDVSFAARTAPQIDSIGSESGSIVVIPFGSVEQHGEHLPVATDTFLASRVATTAAESICGDVPILVSPPVWVGYSPHHLSLGGTITGEFDTLHKVLEQVADSALENGFDAVLFLNGHGGNKSLVDSAVSTVGRAHSDVEVLGLTYFELARPFIDDIRDSDTGGMAHGGEFETSLMQYLYPELVEEEMPAEYWSEHYERGGQDLFESGSLSVYRPFEAYSDSGAIGDPSLASSEKGERIFEGLREELGSVLKEIHESTKSDA